ncbi:unnamed protein product, partial [Mesorhabditis spiculigera]
MLRLLVFLTLFGVTLSIQCYRQTSLPTLEKGDSVECAAGCDFCVTHRIIKLSGTQMERHCGCGDPSTLLGSLVNCKGEGVFPIQLKDATITKSCCRGAFCNGVNVDPPAPVVDVDPLPDVKPLPDLKPLPTVLPVRPWPILDPKRTLPPIPIIVPTVVTIIPPPLGGAAGSMSTFFTFFAVLLAVLNY